MTGTTLAVVYDRGAVSAGDVAVGLAELGRVVFLVPRSAHVERLLPVLEQLGQVVALTGDVADDVRRVRPFAPAAIITFSEPMLRRTAALAAALGLPFHSVEAARLLTDKVRQRRRLRAAGVDDVRSRPIRSLDDWPDAVAHTGLPAVLKPVWGEGSRHTHVVTDEEQAERLVPRLLADLAASSGSSTSASSSTPVLVVEEFLRGRSSLPFGDFVSVESLCGPDGISHLAVTGKLPLVPPFREFGLFWPPYLTAFERQQILDLTTGALRALGVTVGLTHTEIKLTDQGPRIIEVNGRLGGHINELARYAGRVDLVTTAGRLALGEAANPGFFRPDKVHFVCHCLAPLRPCRLVGVHGAKEIRRVAGIDGYRGYARIGDELGGGVMSRYLDLFWGSADDHHAMIATIDDALSRLSYDFGFGADVQRVDAAALCTPHPEPDGWHFALGAAAPSRDTAFMQNLPPDD